MNMNANPVVASAVPRTSLGNNGSGQQQPQQTFKRYLWLLLPLLCVLGAVYFLGKPAQALKQPAANLTQMVNTTRVEPQLLANNFTTHGTVIAARDVVLFPQVSGAVVWVNPAVAPGSEVQAGQVLLKIDPQRYQIALTKAEANLMQAKASLQREQGEQEIAANEYALVKGSVSAEQANLILRKPQLQTALAGVASAEAAVAQAELDLSHTEIKAPFSSVIAEKFSDLGSLVNTNTQLFKLVDRSEYWVKITMPMEKAALLSYGEQSAEVKLDSDTESISRKGGSRALIKSGEGYREAEVYRLLPNLDGAARRAQVLVRVMNPLESTKVTASLSAPDHAENSETALLKPLMLNDYVEVTLFSQNTLELSAIDRAWIREGNQLWVLDQNEQLSIRPIPISFEDDVSVYTQMPFGSGERIIISHVSNPEAGMSLIDNTATSEATNHE